MMSRANGRKRDDVSPGTPDWENDPIWCKNAIIYELHVKAFFDSDGNGMGDFRGPIEKLDYLQDLGANTLWLLPFDPSPMRDNGYDISDFHEMDNRPDWVSIPLFGVLRMLDHPGTA